MNIPYTFGVSQYTKTKRFDSFDLELETSQKLCVALLRPNLMKGKTRGHMTVTSVRRLIDVAFISPREMV